jgi:hypothetical protein
MRLAVSLECGHRISSVIAGDGRYYCLICNLFAAPLAFETREWHVKCTVCRYGRWFGQDEVVAKAAHRQHFCTVDYLCHPVSKKFVRSLYGRRVKVFIPAVVIAKSWPSVRSEAETKTCLPDDPPF